MELKKLREQYEKKFNKKPFNGWKEEKLTEKLKSTPSPIEEEVEKKDGVYKVGDMVQDRIRLDKFLVHELRPNGFIGRKVNNVDDLKWYNPKELVHFIK